EKLRAGFAENALHYLLFLRLVPAFPFWLVNLAPAFLGVSLPVYFGATLVGIIPGTFAFAFVGAGLDSIIDAQMQVFEACVQAGGAAAARCSFTVAPGSLLTPEVLAAFVGLGILALVPIVAKRFAGKPNNNG
ncbi:MAG: VTT domain-containing protein, partial [Hyphomicrobiales bacterium]